MSGDWIVPDWPAPRRVRALSTTRTGGFSRGPYRSLNLGTNCGDDPAAVARNRGVLGAHLPAEPSWLRQVHGADLIVHEAAPVSGSEPPVADAQIARVSGVVSAVLAADCLPVLFCDRAGTEVAAAHAGWRGLAAGVLQRTVGSMQAPPQDILAWLGPAIGGAVYEVGADVRAAFAEQEAQGAGAFRQRGSRWLFDLAVMARHCLRRSGVTQVSGGEWCTYADAERFFSHRRDGICGRMASLIWLE